MIAPHPPGPGPEESALRKLAGTLEGQIRKLRSRLESARKKADQLRLARTNPDLVARYAAARRICRHYLARFEVDPPYRHIKKCDRCRMIGFNARHVAKYAGDQIGEAIANGFSDEWVETLNLRTEAKRIVARSVARIREASASPCHGDR